MSGGLGKALYLHIHLAFDSGACPFAGLCVFVSVSMSRCPGVFMFLCHCVSPE